MRALLAALALAGTLAPQPIQGRVVVLAVPGLSWSSSSVTVTGATGVLAARGPREQTTVAEGLRTLRAGSREPGAGTAAFDALTETGAASVVLSDPAHVAADVRAEVDRGARVIVVGLDTGGTPHLRVALMTGARGRLVSASTRRTGYVQLVDVAPTVLTLLHRPVPAAMTGQPWWAVDTDRPDLIDAERMADAQRRAIPPFFLLAVGPQLLLYGLAARLRRRWRFLFTAYAAVPVATYLAQLLPWWRYGFGFLIADVAAWAVAVAAVGYAGPWRRRHFGPPGAVAVVTTGVLAADLLTGAHLQLGSVAGYSPIVAGRFAGIGNVGFAVFGTAALLAAAALAAGRSRRTQAVVVAAVGAVAVVLDGSPTWGSDLGGVLALVAGFTVLFELVRTGRVAWRRLLLAGVAAAALVTVFALADYARPPEVRTHLGRFVADVRDGRASAVIRRKARANLRLMTANVVAPLAPLGVAVLGAYAIRARDTFRRLPVLRAAVLAILALDLVGFLANDSGNGIPALSMLVAVPATVAALLGRGVENPGDAVLP